MMEMVRVADVQFGKELVDLTETVLFGVQLVKLGVCSYKSIGIEEENRLVELAVALL